MYRKFLIVVALISGLALVALVLPTRAAHDHSVVASPLAPDALPVFEAQLSGANEVPPVSTIASGRAVMVLSEDLTQLHYRVTVADITDVIGAHIHIGAPDEEGPIIFPLYDSSTTTFDPENPISGTLTLTPLQVSELLVGNYYVNVHTTANPDGEIRGQLTAFTPPSNFNAVMLGMHEVPPVDTQASGIARFVLNSSFDMLEYEVLVSDIVSITAAHIHPGAPGQNGPPKITLYAGGDTFGPGDPLTGTAELDAQDLLDLLTGYLYINVHTEDNPAGEIRGQMGTGFQAFEALLAGENEVPPVTTNASGRAVMVLSNDQSTLYYRVTVSDISNVTAAHIHLGPPGENGDIIFPLFTGNGTFDPENPISGTLTLTAEQVATLVAGNYYVNVHTTAHPGGEIRGQLELLQVEDDFHALLFGWNETPPVDTNASGVARFSLLPEMNLLDYELQVANITDITAAHIHPGAPGQVGPPKIPLYTGEGDFGPGNPISGTVSLDAQDLLDLLTGYLYVNVHTTAHPGGEVRGQIMVLNKYYLPFIARQES